MWTVYKHTSPNGKVYIGITSKTPEERWQDGFGYQTNPYFWHDIVKFGWDNIFHEIIQTNLTEDAAIDLESNLIKTHRATDEKFGYNRYDNAHTIYRGESARKAHSERMKALWQDPEYRQKMAKQSKELWKSKDYVAKTKSAQKASFVIKNRV